MRFRLPFRRAAGAAALAESPKEVLPALDALKQEIESDPNFLAWRLCVEHALPGPGANIELCIASYRRTKDDTGRCRCDHIRVLVLRSGDGSESLYRIT